jgi:hypothetical protein
MRKAMKTLVVALVGIAAAYWAFFGWMVYISPLSYAEMDINNDGKVEFFEADYASSYGEREVLKNDRKCLEYFAYKDGLPLRVVCQK